MSTSVQPEQDLGSFANLPAAKPGAGPQGATPSPDLGSFANLPDAAPNEFKPTAALREGANAVLNIPSSVAGLPAAASAATGAVGNVLQAPPGPWSPEHKAALDAARDPLGIGSALRTASPIAGAIGHAVEPVRAWLQHTADAIAPPATDAELGLANHPVMARVVRGGIDMAAQMGGSKLLRTVLSHAAGKLPVGVEGPELAQAMDEDMAASKAQAKPLWDQVDQAPAVSGPRITKLLNTPSAAKAYEQARIAAGNKGVRLPDWGESAAAQPDPNLVAKVAADNPTWSPQNVWKFIASGGAQRLYPDLAQGTSRVEQLSGSGVPMAISPRALQSMKSYLESTLSSAFEKPELKDQAAALYPTLQDAINEARGQSQVYDQALTASEKYKSLEDTRNALQGMLTGQGKAEVATQGGALPAQVPDIIRKVTPSPVSGALAKGAVATGAAATHHPIVAFTSALGALRDAAKASQGRGMLDADELGQLFDLAKGSGTAGQKMADLVQASATPRLMGRAVLKGSKILPALGKAAAATTAANAATKEP